MTYEEAIKYISKVLDNWSSWQTHHQALSEALEVIVKHAEDEGGK